MEGAQAAVELCISMLGVLCLWMGVMEVMRRLRTGGKAVPIAASAAMLSVSQLSKDKGVMDSISANFSANLLGLGNAATPLGLEQ